MSEDTEYYHPSNLQHYHPNNGNIQKYHPKGMVEFHPSNLEHYHPSLTANKAVQYTSEFGFDYKHNGTLQHTQLCPCPMRWDHPCERVPMRMFQGCACYKCGTKDAHVLYTCADALRMVAAQSVGVWCAGCVKKGPLQWSCCDAEEDSKGCSYEAQHNSINLTKYVYTCCGQDRFALGCKQRYVCCEQDQYQSNGCKKRYECCNNSNQSSYGCQAKYVCCDQNITSRGCEEKYLCCDKNKNEKACKERHVCCKLDVDSINNNGCKETYMCCSKPLYSDGCSRKYSCCNGFGDSEGCKEMYSCCNTLNEGCLKFYSCCNQTQNKNISDLRGCCYECCIQPINSEPCIKKCSSCNKPIGSFGCSWNSVQHDMRDIEKVRQIRSEQNQRKQIIQKNLNAYKTYTDNKPKNASHWQGGRAQNRYRGGRGYGRGRSRGRGRGYGRGRGRGRGSYRGYRGSYRGGYDNRRRY